MPLAATMANVSDEAPLKPLPKTEDTLVVRTDFTDNAAWQALCTTIQAPVGKLQFRAYVDCLSDPEYDGSTPEQLRAAAGSPTTSNHTFIFIVDRTALTHREHPILVLDLYIVDPLSSTHDRPVFSGSRSFQALEKLDTEFEMSWAALARQGPGPWGSWS
jgi:hypothetical protein